MSTVPDRYREVSVTDVDVPLELEQLCIRATARDPEDRPASARVLHDLVAAACVRCSGVAERGNCLTASTRRRRLDMNS